MRFDLRFADRDREAAFKNFCQAKLVRISAAVAICSFASTILTAFLPATSNVFASSVYGRVLCSATACLIFALCSFRCRRAAAAPMDWLDFEILAIVNLFCLAWSVLLLPGVSHTFALATVLMISWMLYPIRSCRSWIFPCVILLLHFVATPCCLDDGIFVGIVGIVSQYGFRLQERFSRIVWNLPNALGETRTRIEDPLFRCRVSDVDPAFNAVIEVPSNTVAISETEMATELGANLDTRSSFGMAMVLGSRRSSLNTLSSSPSVSAASSSDVNSRPSASWPVASHTASSPFSSFVRPSSDTSAFQVHQRETPPPAHIVSVAVTPRTCTSSSQSRPSNPLRPTPSNDGQSWNSVGRLLSDIFSSNASRQSHQSDRPSSYDTLATLTDSEFSSEQWKGSCDHDHIQYPGADQIAEYISSLEATLHHTYASLAASRYVAGLTCAAVLRVGNIFMNDQHDSFQREIAHVRDLAAWEARKTAIAEQNRYAAKLEALRARDIICASAENGRPNQNRRKGNGSLIQAMDGEWELIESDTLPDVHLRALSIKGDRVTDGCGQDFKLHHKVTFEGRELIMEDDQLVRVGNHGRLFYRRSMPDVTW